MATPGTGHKAGGGRIARTYGADMTKPHRAGQDRRRRARRELLEATEAAPIAMWRPRRKRPLNLELLFTTPPADLRAARERRRRALG